MTVNLSDLEDYGFVTMGLMTKVNYVSHKHICEIPLGLLVPAAKLGSLSTMGS
jgi:hypothetical protein